MDVLSDILGTLDFQGSLYFTTEFTPPWGVRVPPLGNVARFHLVMRGSCCVSAPGEPESARLEHGDLVLIPHGAEHVLSDDPSSPVLDVDEIVARTGFSGRGNLVFGGEDGGQPTRLLCGHFAFDAGAAHPFLLRLPRRIVIRSEEVARHGWLDESFRSILREVQNARPGGDAVVKRLSEVLFIQIVRLWAELPGGDPGVLSALGDPHLARSLEALHRDPGRAWTLESLAREAGLSRTVFADRFHRLMSMTPMQYVACWRIEEARRLLRQGSATIDSVATRVGYASPAAFSRVFRRWTGRSPGGYRRELRRSDAVPAGEAPGSDAN